MSSVTTAKPKSAANRAPSWAEISAEQLRIRKRRFPELLEEQQAQNSATDPDYLTFD